MVRLLLRLLCVLIKRLLVFLLVRLILGGALRILLMALVFFSWAWGLVNGVYWFQVVYPDNSTQQFTQDELLAIGFKIANLSDRVLRLSYNTEDYLVMPRPLPQYQPQQPDNAQILTNQPLANL